MTRTLQVAVGDFRRSLGEGRWRLFDDALRRRVEQSAAGAEYCRRRGEGLDLFTVDQLYRRGWVNVFSVEPVDLDEPEARGFD